MNQCKNFQTIGQNSPMVCFMFGAIEAGGTKIMNLGDGVNGPFTGLINFASILNMFNALDIKWRIDN